MATVGVTALGAIAAGYYGKKSEVEKQKQIESEILSLDGPSRSIREKLGDIRLISRSIKKEDDTQLDERKEKLDSAEATLKKVEKFADTKFASQEKEIQDLFKKAAAALEQETRSKQQENTPAKDRTKSATGVRSAISRAASKFTRSGAQNHSEPTKD